ncbi:MAG: hypothetical protein ACOCUP_03070, partial [bacterium]
MKIVIGIHVHEPWIPSKYSLIFSTHHLAYYSIHKQKTIFLTFLSHKGILNLIEDVISFVVRIKNSHQSPAIRTN